MAVQSTSCRHLTMRLADHLVHANAAILQAWEAHARAHAPAAAGGDASSLRQGVPQLLGALAAALALPVAGGAGDEALPQLAPTPAAASACDGHAAAALAALSSMSAPAAHTALAPPHLRSAPAGARLARAADRVAASAAAHGAARLRSGYALAQLVDELLALRACVLQGWRTHLDAAGDAAPHDVARFHQLLDVAMSAAVAHYTRALAHSEHRFEQALLARLQAPLKRALDAQHVVDDSGADARTRAQALERIGQCNAQMHALLEELRDFARVRRAGALAIAPARADLGEVCTGLLAQLRLRHPRRALRYRSTGPLDGWWDAARLRQALGTLIEVALGEVEAMAPLTISVEGQANAIVATIAQRGAVACEDVLARFVLAPGRRWQAGAADSAEEQRAAAIGNSIGMVIARAIVAAHGGTITWSAGARAGAGFTLRLPRRSGRA
jgi:signal transduction histidine kinase